LWNWVGGMGKVQNHGSGRYTSCMKRFTRLAAALVAVALLAMPARADVQDFSFKSFNADYTLTRDAGRVAHLRVVETLVAEFPNYDQNHGILRAIPKTYRGHNNHLSIDSVTDQSHQIIPFTESEQNHNLVLKIGDAGKYVHGEQTYIITYNEDSITANPAGYDGLFVDVNGDQWSQ
jgi:hypothetical protein